MKQDYCVYKHTSPSGKVYIGITCRENPETRWRNGYGYFRNAHFRNAIKKHGWNGFEHEIIQQGLTHDEANNVESELIRQFDSSNPLLGYNVSPGGGAWADETREKSSAAIKKAWADPERRTEWVAAISRGLNKPEYIEQSSKRTTEMWRREEIRSKILISIRAASNTEERKKLRIAAAVKMWATPEIRAKLLSSLKAAANTPESKALVSKHWKGRNDSEETQALRSKSMKKHYESSDARKYLSDGVKKGWENPSAKIHHAEGTKKYWEQHAKKVLCVETGTVYDSVKIAGECVSISQEGIRGCCKKLSHYNTSGGYHWEWYTEPEEQSEAVS